MIITGKRRLPIYFRPHNVFVDGEGSEHNNIIIINVSRLPSEINTNFIACVISRLPTLLNLYQSDPSWYLSLDIYFVCSCAYRWSGNAFVASHRLHCMFPFTIKSDVVMTSVMEGIELPPLGFIIAGKRPVWVECATHPAEKRPDLVHWHARKMLTQCQ